MLKQPLCTIIAIAAISLPATAVLAQFNGAPRRARPSPPAPAPPPIQPAAVPVQAAPAATGSDFALPPPPPPPPPQASVPPPAAAIPVDPPFRLGRGDEIVKFRADSASAAITRITDLGRPLPTRGLGTAQVEVLLKADPDEGYGTPCDTEGFVVALANGVTWKPMTNFCNSNHIVSVPSARPPAPSPLPTVPKEFAWQFNKMGEEGMLAYGIPQTDQTVFLARCSKGSTRIDTRFVAEAGPQPRIDLHGGDVLLRYDLVANEPQSDEEPRTNGADLAAADPLWALLRQGLKLPYRIGEGPFALLDTGAGRAPIGQFVTWCGGA